METGAYVMADLQFVAPGEDKPVYYASEAGEDAELKMDGLFDHHSMRIENGRTSDHPFTLDKHGFELVSQTTNVQDFYQNAQITDVYEDEVKTLIKRATGASRVEIFDHTLRSDSASTREARNIREPSTVVHNDYTENSAPKRVRDILPDEADTLLAGRFAIINAWRPIKTPILRMPLAMCTADSLAAGDLIDSERRAKDRIGELTLVRHNPAHRWVYFPQMQLNETVLIKTFDSATDGRARWSIHSAFADPTTPADAPPRESIETRTFAFF